MVERRECRDAIELLIRQLIRHHITLHEFNVPISPGPLVSEPNHLRGEVDCENLCRALREQSGESSGAATDFKNLLASFRKLLQPNICGNGRYDPNSRRRLRQSYQSRPELIRAFVLPGSSSFLIAKCNILVKQVSNQRVRSSIESANRSRRRLHRSLIYPVQLFSME